MSASTDRPFSRAFTLIELLVVVSVIAVLIAMLLPSLGRASLVAKRAKAQSDLRQVTMGFLFYANQFNKDKLEPSMKGIAHFGAFYSYCSVAYSGGDQASVNIEPVFYVMQLTRLTQHPVTAFPAIDSPLNGVAGVNGERSMPWCYWPGYEMTNFPTTRTLQSPIRVTDGTANHTLFSEQLWYRFTTYVSQETDDVSAVPFFGSYQAATPLGAYASTYDGAIRMRLWSTFQPTSSAAIWVDFYGGGNALLANMQR